MFETKAVGAHSLEIHSVEFEETSVLLSRSGGFSLKQSRRRVSPRKTNLFGLFFLNFPLRFLRSTPDILSRKYKRSTCVFTLPHLRGSHANLKTKPFLSNC
ncbi:hypothetical protein NPIL_248431 [Nephila pilipes]|uniref:Uncharacterized protein n=1 Tax=Nephila pilipes TaxID=299642 RepID=A0A8X6QBS4_NEPPI|nr:hypothetical protein NPIL_248431 [Nephila pilipes]